MDPEQLFLHRLDDLRLRCSRSQVVSADHEYRVLMAAPLLRECLIEGALVARVNKAHGLKIIYRCVPLESLAGRGLPEPVFQIAGDGFAMPETFNPHMVKDLNPSLFLNAAVAFLHGERITVQDLIDYLANAAGGTHYDEQPKRNRPAVNELNNMISINGYQAALYALMAVGRVVVVGLLPLADAVSQASEQ